MAEHPLPTLPDHDIQVVYPVRGQLPKDAPPTYVCPACDKPLEPGSYIARAMVGPGPDPATREAARAGASHQPLFMLLHYECATGDVGDPAVSKSLWMAALLARGQTTVILPEGAVGVDLPADFPWTEGAGALNFSYNFSTRDLLVSEDGVFQTLSFKGQQHPCFVPWGAIRAFRQAEPYKVFVLYGDAPETEEKPEDDGDEEPAIVPVPWAPHLGVVN